MDSHRVLVTEHLENIHAEENIVLWTDAQTLPDGTQLGPDVPAQDEGSAGGWRKEAGQDGPANRGPCYEGTKAEPGLEGQNIQ